MEIQELHNYTQAQFEDLKQLIGAGNFTVYANSLAKQFNKYGLNDWMIQ